MSTQTIASPARSQTQTAIRFTAAAGDGVGPEIMDATLRVLDAAGCDCKVSRVELGEKVYRQGVTSGIAEETWEAIRSTGVLLKAPISTPQGKGFKSVNVTLRKTLGLYANVRPCVAYPPFVPTRHPKMDVVIIRENEEDLYAGIEHRQTDEVMQCLKLITRPGCERIIRYAFEYARAYGRSKVTCMTKDNIMKLTDGLFHRVFDEIAPEYPEISNEHMIVDIGAARLADSPERFDVVVLPNLYGDILSDVAAQLAGSIGIAGSANVGQYGAMFEAIHGTAPDIAGTNTANPSGLLMAAVMMLVHLRRPEEAALVKNAWLRTIEDGIHTADMCGATTTKRVGTREFADEVIARLGAKPLQFREAMFSASDAERVEVSSEYVRTISKKEMVGVDIFLHSSEHDGDGLAAVLQAHSTASLSLKMITNRGVKVWPAGHPETFATDHWRCRFMHPGGATISHREILALMANLVAARLDIIKTENLCNFDGEPGFAMGQGQ